MAQTKLILPNGESCETLEQLRESYTNEWAISVIEDSSLLTWLNEMYYEQAADDISNINPSERDEVVLRAFRRAIGIAEPAKSSEAEQRLRELTDDPELLKKADCAAFNQRELAELLNRNCEDILLCSGVFNIPLSKGNVAYTAVGEPTITAPSRTDMARNHIKLNGYSLDSDTENSAQLAELIEAFTLTKYDPIIALSLQSYFSKYYDSKREAKEARHDIAEKCYIAASRYLNSGERSSIARSAAVHYSQKIAEVFEKNKKAVMQLGATDEQVTQLEQLCNCYKPMLNACNEELWSGDFYNLYKLSYFEKLIDIEEFEELRNGVLFAWNLHNHPVYSLFGYEKPKQEIEKDLNELARSMWTFAYNEFVRTVQEPVCKLLTEIASSDNAASA